MMRKACNRPIVPTCRVPFAATEVLMTAAASSRIELSTCLSFSEVGSLVRAGPANDC